MTSLSPSEMSRSRGEFGLGQGKLPRIRSPVKKKRCGNRIWIFLILGAVTVSMGMVVAGLNYNIQSITSSSQHTEVLIPTYVIAATVILTGLSVILLFWKRPAILVIASVILCLGSGFVSGLTSILTGTHVLRPLESLSVCQYHSSPQHCQCYSSYSRTVLDVTYSETDKTLLIFADTANCASIELSLPPLLYALCVVYAVVLLLTTGSAILALLVLRLERARGHFRQNETYEEIFTVSGGSSSQTLSDVENEAGEIQPARTIIQPTDTSNSCKGTGAREITQTIDIPSDKSRRQSVGKSCQSLGKCNGQSVGKSSAFAKSKRISRSCDSLTDIDPDPSTSTAGLAGGKKGKLKEHRRRERRAVTLHNLDTKQLMLILNLQMRYLQEAESAENSKNPNLASEQGAHLNPVAQNRRAVTPQPFHTQRTPNTLPKSVRSHTPQPYRTKRERQSSTDSHDHLARTEFTQGFDEYYQKMTRDSQHSRRNTPLESSGSRIKNCENFSRNIENLDFHRNHGNRHKNSPMPGKMCASNPREPDMRKLENTGPKSRPSVQNYFLPPEPIHRQNKAQLPPQPITRQASQRKDLPPQPVHRGHESAFHIVEPHLRQPHSNHPLSTGTRHVEDSNRRQQHPHPSVSKREHTVDGQTNCDHAIRENFSMYPSPFMLQNTHGPGQIDLYPVSDRSFRSPASEPPPPYAPPPSYAHFVSCSRDNSVHSSDSLTNSENSYAQPSRRARSRPNEHGLYANAESFYSHVSRRNYQEGDSYDDDVFTEQEPSMVEAQYANGPWDLHGYYSMEAPPTFSQRAFGDGSWGPSRESTDRRTPFDPHGTGQQYSIRETIYSQVQKKAKQNYNDLNIPVDSSGLTGDYNIGVTQNHEYEDVYDPEEADMIVTRDDSAKYSAFNGGSVGMDEVSNMSRIVTSQGHEVANKQQYYSSVNKLRPTHPQDILQGPATSSTPKPQKTKKSTTKNTSKTRRSSEQNGRPKTGQKRHDPVGDNSIPVSERGHQNATHAQVFASDVDIPHQLDNVHPVEGHPPVSLEERAIQSKTFNHHGEGECYATYGEYHDTEVTKPCLEKEMAQFGETDVLRESDSDSDYMESMI